MTKIDAVDVVILECLLHYRKTNQAIKSKALWSQDICRYPLQLSQRSLTRRLIKLNDAQYIERLVTDVCFESNVGHWYITSTGIAAYQLSQIGAELLGNIIDVT